jgi:hypothetical protein
VLPADGILRAAQRWLSLLARSTFPQAAALVRSDPAYIDLSQTQYASALEWLRTVELLVDSDDGPTLASGARRLDLPGANRLMFAKALEQAAPAWLPDADTLVPDADELPADAVDLAGTLGLTDNEALLSVRQIHGRIDLAERARVGAAGERALVMLLEQQWPNSTRHVALEDDGLGYDIEFSCDGTVWHLEVKSTTRRGRLTIYLSRHEHDVARLDPQWRLVVVGLNSADGASAIATVASEPLLGRSPRDQNPAAQWDSVRHQLSAADLQPGLTFIKRLEERKSTSALHEGVDGVETFGWMPE